MGEELVIGASLARAGDGDRVLLTLGEGGRIEVPASRVATTKFLTRFRSPVLRLCSIHADPILET